MESKYLIIGVGVVALATVAMVLLHSVGVKACYVEIDKNLTVTPDIISYETTFPQEVLLKPLSINLSQSFLDSWKHDDVEYRIKQKPKPRIDNNTERAYCAAHPLDYSRCSPSLCPYLSKTPDNSPENDTGVPAFHDPSDPASIAYGRIAKSDEDLSDSWVIDLHVPCFEGQCAQDWASFVLSQNPEANPEDYMLDPALEHEVFGCDLKIEVTEVSYFHIISRTPGFWQTHTAFTSSIFADKLGGSMTVGTGSHTRTITNLPGNGQSRLFGAWYSSIPKKTNNQNRNSIDKARMQLLQQLVAAKINCAAFTCPPGVQTIITQADQAYATGTSGQMLGLSGQLDVYNNFGDPNPIPPELGPVGGATPAQSQQRANKIFWNQP